MPLSRFIQGRNGRIFADELDDIEDVDVLDDDNSHMSLINMLSDRFAYENLIHLDENIINPVPQKLID